MKVYIETKRLLLRNFVIEDYKKLFLLDSNAEVMKYIGMSPLTKPEESKKVIEMILQQYKDNGIGRIAVIEKSTDKFIGWSGLKINNDNINNHQNFHELGYRFLPETWGKGYATESGIASLNYGFHHLKIETIYAYAHSENLASQKTLQKLGFEKMNEFLEPDGICFWYELRKENFKY